MKQQQGLNAYRQTEVQSRTPLELVVMLHDGALRHLLAAKTAIGRNDIRARKEAVGRLLAIVSELQNTLDVERGGDIATSLDELYGYMMSRIMDAVAKNNAAPLTEVERIIVTLREGWQAIATAPPNALAGTAAAGTAQQVPRVP
jgi:flagellar secretion chaperone FliS